MKNPNASKPGNRDANASQCKGDYSTYVFQSGQDECVKPGAVEKVTGTAEKATAPVKTAVGAVKGASCKLVGKQSNGDECKKGGKPAQAVETNTPAKKTELMIQKHQQRRTARNG